MDKQMGDGFLHIAQFVEVVYLNKEAYPNGIKRYDVSTPDNSEVLEVAEVVEKVEEVKSV